MGSGDGKVKKMVGQDTKWILQSEILLKGAVKSLSPDYKTNEILAGTSDGNIYKLFPEDLSATLNTEGHISPIIDISF